MTDWPKPTRTDIHEMHRREDEYYINYYLHKQWKVKPGPSGYDDGAVDSTWCSVVVEGEEHIRVAEFVRGWWASHIVALHNAWFEAHKGDPAPEGR